MMEITFTVHGSDAKDQRVKKDYPDRGEFY